MKLLLDQNLSHRLVERLRDVCPEIVHVGAVGLGRADDEAVWQYAATHGCIVVTKDSDFNARAFVFGPPPKVVWIRRGNCSTSAIEALLRERRANTTLEPTCPLGDGVSPRRSSKRSPLNANSRVARVR